MKILLIEDDYRMRQAIAETLKSERYGVEAVRTGQEGADRALDEAWDAIVLDLMLPDMEGFEVLRRIRGDGCEAPVLILSARGEVDDRVRGLDAGADDYLPKPFSTPELLARLRALLRRQGGPKETVLSTGPLSLDTAAREVRYQGSVVAVTPKEFMVLEFLMHHPGTILTRLQISEHIYDDGALKSSHVIDMHVRNLRKKIGDERVIETVRGVGYRIHR